MSSNPASLLPKSFAVIAVATALGAQPLAAQDDVAVTAVDETAAETDESAAPAPSPPAGRAQFGSAINLSVTVPKNESDQLLEEDCEEEADAGRIAGEIVVCRRLGEASDGSWNREDWERRYAQRTQGGRTPDTFGIANHGNAIGGLCVIPPCPPEAAIMIDVEALPQAPEGTDADRIARGLPPLGRDGEPTPEEIAARRRALGLDAPPVPDE